MSDVVATSPMQYLDRATRALQAIGIAPPQAIEAPIAGLLEKITTLDEDRIVIIARTLGQTSVFNEVVREQVQAMEIGERYRQITESFNSIRDDTKKMVDQLEDQKIDLFERINNVWMKLSRGDVADRFDEIRQVYLDVTRSTKDQIQREQVILDAYRDFRGALKHAEVMALEVLKIAEQRLEGAQAELQKASDAVANFTGQEVSERARLELARDEQLRRTQDEEKRYQIAKDLSDNLTIGYNTSEVVMARLMQMTNAKERVYAQAVTFFSTNDSVFTALKASFTGMFGLNESTQTLNEMKEGVSRSLEVLAEIGDQVGEAAIRAGYGPTIRADAVKKLVDSVITFQERSQEIIGEMRQLATRNSAEIRDAVEEGKRRIARLVAEGQALPANG
ncbi:cell surface protein [Bradyrhizobium yuanmingense]|uniref:cell surface protein n=1 Tax=Bradyrhizobium TaxID=374 RepID=UPI0012FC369E|nr:MULTISPECIES: cell surface protein [Bradyrhizobium]MDA9543285.1 cell surface protein [Bradyrhizobium sp. CCBAU 45321]MDF0495550.1 cell surface protein [Bradyrhizobium yuanmingense]MDF0581619.1 cell surface protein [Bradyrhizobium yuanmingense]MVT51397.1 cell surface protein [Bradyrhizobium yuanmingense]